MVNSFTVTIKKDTARPWLRRFRRELESRPRALVAALNRTAEAARTVSIRAVQADVGASSQKSIRANIFIDKAFVSKFDRKRRLESRVEARSGKKDRIPIIELSPSRRTPAKRRLATAGITWGSTRNLIPGAFVGRMLSGHIGVFKRLAKARLPIAELFGPSVAHVFGKRKIIKAMEKVVDERLPRELSRVLTHLAG